MRTVRMGIIGGLLGATMLCLSVAGQAFAGGGVAQARSAVCGTDSATGLGVSAAGDVDCGAALSVAAAYTKVWRSASGAPVDVRAAGAGWKCQERQGDPNPYQECVNTSDSGRRVMLTS
ncbi:hypothetical protein ACWEN3_41700 [Streptomyces sp. NPDC004561]